MTERFGPDTPFGFHRVSTPSGMGPGAGERSNGGDVAGPVERYDLVSSRQQPPAGEPCTRAGSPEVAGVLAAKRARRERLLSSSKPTARCRTG